MFGYATDETAELTPAPLQWSHNILHRLAQARHAGEHRLEPDAKSQVTVQYENGVPARILKILVSHQHQDGLTPSDVEAIIKPYALEVLPAGMVTADTEWPGQPDRQFRHRWPGWRCGPDRPQDHRRHLRRRGAPRRRRLLRQGSDQGRSLGRLCPALSGQERRGRRLAKKCTLQVSYAIGVSRPLSFYVDTHGTGQVDEEKLEAILPELIGGLTPKSIRLHLGLNRPIYERTTAYGHFGQTPDADGGFSWENTDLVDALKGEF